MKASIRLGGILGSVAFLAITVRSYSATLDPFMTLVYSIGAALALGATGYVIGNIIDHPEGHKRKKNKKSKTVENNAVNVPLTGEETFVNEIGTPS